MPASRADGCSLSLIVQTGRLPSTSMQTSLDTPTESFRPESLVFKKIGSWSYGQVPKPSIR